MAQAMMLKMHEPQVHVANCALPCVSCSIGICSVEPIVFKVKQLVFLRILFNFWCIVIFDICITLKNSFTFKKNMSRLFLSHFKSNKSFIGFKQIGNIRVERRSDVRRNDEFEAGES